MLRGLVCGAHASPSMCVHEIEERVRGWGREMELGGVVEDGVGSGKGRVRGGRAKALINCDLVY